MKKLISSILIALLVSLGAVQAQNTIDEILFDSAQFIAFSTALQGTSLGLDDPDASLTVFAPTNRALADFDDATGTLAAALSPEALAAHVVSGSFTIEDLIAQLEENDGELTLETVDGGELDLFLSEDGVIIVNGTARLTDAGSIIASNGVIHTTDGLVTGEADLLESNRSDVVPDQEEDSVDEEEPLDEPGDEEQGAEESDDVDEREDLDEEDVPGEDEEEEAEEREEQPTVEEDVVPGEDEEEEAAEREEQPTVEEDVVPEEEGEDDAEEDADGNG